MNLKGEVLSLELSKKLKELGLEQDSLFYYWKPENALTNQYILIYERNITNEEWKADIHISAFTIAELGKMLPFFVEDLELIINKRHSWLVCYKNNKEQLIKSFVRTNLADAMAEMLIYLIENGLIKNER